MTDNDLIRVRYRYLSQLLGMYFGEDWFDEYESDEEASIADYITRTREQSRAHALAELDRMRADAESPQAFERDFGYLSRAYLPDKGPTAYRDFADRLAAAIRTSLPDGDLPEP